MQDLTVALRQFRKSPGFAATVILTISLGIGANVAIFTLVHAVLLKSLPVANPASLYRIGDTDDCCVSGGFVSDHGDFDLFSYKLYRHFEESAPEFEELAAFQSGHGTMNVRSGPASARSERTEYVSGNYFSTFGLGAYAGRVLIPNDDRPGAAPVAVISYQAWQAAHGADPSIVGSTFYIKSQPVTIVGIAPPGFFGDRIDSDPPALWIPLNDEPLLNGETSILQQGEANWLYALGRVRPGVGIGGLQAKLSNTLRQWLATQTRYTINGNDARIPKQYVVLTPGGAGVQNLQQETGSGLRLLMAISGLVLLVACANVANLLLAKSATRRTETSIRIALGAARSRLIRQLLVESVVLGCAGGAIGIAVAYGGARMILSLAFPDATQLPIQASPSLAVLAFAFLLSLITGMVFGIVPAWISSHSDPAEALRGANRATRDRASLPQRSLIVFQAALSLVLLVGAGLLTQSLRNVTHQDFGIETAHRYVIHLDPSGAGYTIARVPVLNEQLERELSALPGIKSLGLALYSPLEGDNWGERVYVEGRPDPGPEAENNSSWDRVSPHFFETVGQPVIRGRGFTEQDTATSRMVAVVNPTFVKKFFPNQDPIGHHFGTFEPKYSGDYEIVGVVADAKYSNPRDPVRPMYFRPGAQFNTGLKETRVISAETASMFINSITIRYTGDTASLESQVRRTLSNINPNLILSDFKSMDYQVAGNFNQERLIARLTTLFGVLALLLASVGLYGITAYSVARRTSEIGLRMALGANRGNVVALVLQGAFFQVGLGLAMGVPAALLGAHVMANQLYAVRSYDPFTLLAAVLVLFTFAGVAGFIPARRAASVEPMNALRTE